LRSPLRKNTFLAGRILLKRLLIGSLDLRCSARDLTVDSRSAATGHGERPVLTIEGRAEPLAISIAHSERGVLVAYGDHAAISLGVDLVAREAITERVHWTFTPAEREWLASTSAPQFAAEQLWARKEALYKASQRGEGFQPARIEVVPGRLPTYAAFDPSAELLCLQTWRIDGHVAALAVTTPRRASQEPQAILRAA
jgi:phosphopantetheinyl transferase